MLVSMESRGPDSAGFAIYNSDKNKIYKYSICLNEMSFEKFKKEIKNKVKFTTIEKNSDHVILKSNENTALLLLPIEEIDLQNNDGEFRIYGSFGELFDIENEIINQSGYENVFDGKLGFKVPGDITKPNISNIVDNTIIFEADGVSSKTFELISSNDRPLNPINIAIAFILLSVLLPLTDMSSII